MTCQKAFKNHALNSAMRPCWWSSAGRAGPRCLFVPFNIPAPLLFFLFILLAHFPANASGNPSGKILVLNSYHPGYSWSDSIMAGISEGLTEQGLQAELDIEYLDTKEHLPQDVFPVFAELLKAKFSKQSPDLIIASDNNALDFLLSRGDRLFPDIPIVFCGINNFSEEMIRGQPKITGVAEDHSYRETLELARRLHPERTTLVAVSDFTESGRMNLAGFRKAAAGLAEKVTIIELAGLPEARLQEQLRNLPAKAVLFHLDYYLTPEGTTFTVEESFNLIRANSSLPIYVNTDNKIGFGAVGGIVATGRLQGVTAARMAARILAGESPDDIPILRRAPCRPVFDYNALREFAIPLQRLPADSRIINQPHSFYSLYKNYIWIAAVFVAALLLMILFLLNTIRRRQTAEQALRENEQRYRQLFESSPDALFVHDTAGRFLDVNSVAEQRYGYSREELLTMSPTDLAAAALRPQVEGRLKQALEAGARFEWVHRRKDGSELPVEISARPLLLGGKRCGLSSVRDITARVRAEKELQRNERVLRLFVEHSPAAIAMFDREMKYIVASRRYAIDYGLGEQELIGRSHSEVFPEMPERWQEIHRRCLAGATEKAEDDPFPRVDGRVDYVRWEIHPWYEKEGEIGGIILFSEIVTQRKKMLEEIRAANQELLAINRIIATTTTTTTTTTGVQGLLEKILDEALAATGLEGGTICLVTPDDRLHLAAHRGTSEATIEDLTTNVVKVGDCLCGESARDHKPLILPDREAVLGFSTRESTRGEDIRFHAAFPLLADEKCPGVLCVFTRTDSKPTERSLKLLESISAQVAMAVRYAQLHEEIVHHAETLENRVSERTFELEKARQALANLLEEFKGKNEELATANKKLQELDRLKSMFIASMSHELRTPLNSVIGFSRILKDEWLGPVNDEQKKNLGYILDSGKHLLSLINDVIDLSKIEAGMLETDTENFALVDLVAEALAAVKPTADEKGITLESDVPSVAMFSDRRRLLQCLLNILGNGVKFTDSGRISVTAAAGSRENGKTVKIEMKDTGIGIRPGEMNKLFKPFSRLHSPGSSKYPGTGLGLYLTRKLVQEVLQGNISVSSIYGEGSVFIIEVPAHLPAESNEGTMP